ncbi:hypothetical protein [Polynucleobacter alcilacus]|uniref:hypothetical protein n=1 Tax=Polynucleobacter alcilacus TaxID=1819739 RepID=UPI001C0AB72A|nr:hypothetical protein [Polynucleobacter alcilacus]MBU3568189.1 hypothetical protein [Polynucleobacter alcilacus]
MLNGINLGIKNLILKYRWPLLELIDPDYSYSYKCKYLFFLENNLEAFSLKNKNFKTLEIINSSFEKDLIANNLVSGGFAHEVHIANFFFSTLRLVDIDLATKIRSNNPTAGLFGSDQRQNLSSLKFKSHAELCEHLLLPASSYPLVILHYHPQLIEVLENVSFLNSYYILLLNNNEGLFSTGNNQIRTYLANKGFIFKSRMNQAADFFVASNAINGFPKELFIQIGTTRLQKLVSLPPDGDFTRFR